MVLKNYAIISCFPSHPGLYLFELQNVVKYIWLSQFSLTYKFRLKYSNKTVNHSNRKITSLICYAKAIQKLFYIQVVQMNNFLISRYFEHFWIRLMILLICSNSIVAWVGVDGNGRGPIRGLTGPALLCAYSIPNRR